jgi:hypothetical protein
MILKGRAAAYAEGVEQIFKDTPKRELTESEQLNIFHIYETMQRDKKFYYFMSAMALSYGLASLNGQSSLQSFLESVASALSIKIEEEKNEYNNSW